MMWSTLLLALAVKCAVAASANAVGSAGYYNLTTPGFILELDKANQVATRLIARPGQNSGADPFNFLLPTPQRTDDGNYFLGDIQLQLRNQNDASWTSLSSHYARKAVKVTPGNGGVLTSADLSASMGGNFPLKVNRTWSQDRDSIVMTFNLTNMGTNTIEVGGVGIPLPINNNWVGKDQTGTWTESVVSDPAISLDAGYVITNRLGGQSPTLVMAPVEKTPLEQYRLNYPSEPSYPAVFLDKVPLDYNYEGIFSWWMASKGLVGIDSATASAQGFTLGNSYNDPTSFLLAPGASRIVGLRLFTASGARTVENRLIDYGRPTIVGIPGFVVPAGEQVKLIVKGNSPTVQSVQPAYIDFSAPVNIGSGQWSIVGTVRANTFGQTRVTLKFGTGDLATAHYTVTAPYATQLDNLGQFRFSKQYYTNTSDYFGRAPSIITYDNKKKTQVTDDPRAWVAGLSDEAGTGAYVSAATKQLGRPNAAEIAKLEDFVTKTLFGKIQISQPGATYAGVKKSIFYYDASLVSKGVYDPSVDHGGTWGPQEANLLSRSYDYPHPLVVYWTLYRLARNYEGLTRVSWRWYLDRAYDTIISMQKNAGLDAYAQFGLMEGSYFQEVLFDLYREGYTNSSETTRAQTVQAFMKQRADIWNSETYPFASEFPWDNTAQEEVYLWTNYFGYNDKAAATIETLVAIMPSVPHWGYSGSGRDLWDFQFSGQIGPGARLERIFHHYKGSQSALPLINAFQRNPTDISLLRAAYGGIIGPLSSIGADGFGSTGFHTRPDYLSWDPLSGDNGVNMALHSLSSRTILVNDASFGGWAAFGGALTTSGTSITVRPYDSMRQRFFITPTALLLELDAGKLSQVVYDTSSKTVTVTFDAADKYTPKARLRLRTTAGTSYYKTQGSYQSERECFVVPLSQTGTTKVVLTLQ